MKRKWNWIDTGIIVVIILLIVVFYNRDKILKRGDETAASNKKNVVITVEADELTEDMVTDLKVGDQIFSQNSLQDGFVEEVSVSPSLDTEVGPDGKIRVYEKTGEVKLTAKISAAVKFSGPYMELGGQEVKVGIPFILKTTNFEVKSTIKHIEVK